MMMCIILVDEIMFLGIFILRGNYLLIFEENYYWVFGGKINLD